MSVGSMGGERVPVVVGQAPSPRRSYANIHQYFSPCSSLLGWGRLSYLNSPFYGEDLSYSLALLFGA